MVSVGALELVFLLKDYILFWDVKCSIINLFMLLDLLFYFETVFVLLFWYIPAGFYSFTEGIEMGVLCVSIALGMCSLSNVY